MESSEDRTLYARVTWAEIKTERIDDAVSGWKSALSSQKQASGFHDAYLLVDRTARSALAVTLWDTRAQAEQKALEQERLGALAGDLAGQPDIEAFNVPVRTAKIKPATYARMTSADIRGLSEIESGVIWEDALPEYERVPGFQGAFMLQAIHSAQGIVITFWENEEAARRTSESGMRTAVLSRFVEVMTSPPVTEGFAVELQV